VVHLLNLLLLLAALTISASKKLTTARPKPISLIPKSTSLAKKIWVAA
jgi:hypothetical protein